MKTKLLIIALMLSQILTSCGVNTSGNVNVDPENIQYFKDSRTNLCFGIVASRKSGSYETTGLGVTCVPCEAVEHLLNK